MDLGEERVFEEEDFMKRYLGIFLCLAVVLVPASFAVKGWQEAKFEADKGLSETRLRADYLERISWMRSIPSETAYQSEMKNFLQWYFGRINQHVKEFKLNPRFDDYLERLAGLSHIDRPEERRRVYENVRSVFDLMQHGRYHPQWTASNQNVRLDVLSSQVIFDKGERKIRYQLVIWGLPRTQTLDDQKRLRVHNRASFRAQWRMFDLKGKAIAEMRLEGDMAGRVDWPELYVSMFPADVTLGHYDVDLMPSNAETVEISFNIFSPSLTGGDMRPTFVWKRAVPPEWRLNPGEEWKNAMPVEGLSAAQSF